MTVARTPFEFGPIEMRSPKELRPYEFRTFRIPDPNPDDDMHLRESIQEHGVRRPLAILSVGRVLDGRARLRHALALALSEVPTRTLLTKATDREIQIYGAQRALARRHLTSVQHFEMLYTWGVMGSVLRKECQEQATENRRLRGRPRSTGQTTVSADLTENQKGRKTKELVAEVIGVSYGTAFKLIAIKERGSFDLFQKVLHGDLSVDAAYRAICEQTGKGHSRLGRMVSETLDLLDVKIPQRHSEFREPFKGWPRRDQDQFLDIRGRFLDTLNAILKPYQTHGINTKRA